MTTATAKSKAKDTIKTLFNSLLESARKVQDFNPTEQEVAVMHVAFEGIFKHNTVQLRAAAPSWKGWKRNDGSIDEKARLQSLQSAFCRMFHWHRGTDNAYLGTIINATDNLGSIAEAFGLVPNELNPFAWKLGYDSPEYAAHSKLRAENKVVEKRFADCCDTLIRVFIYTFSKGKTTSIAADIWAKALHG